MTTNLLDCGHPVSAHSEITTGYGTDASGKTFCYACCADRDRATMRADGKITLYLVKRDDGYHVTNWPSSLDFKVKGIRRSRHNIGRERIDFWFNFDGFEWHGYQIGDYNEIAHCKRTKTQA